MEDPLLERLAELDSGAVSDAMDLVGRTGAVLGLNRLSGTERFVGLAVTVKLGPHDGVAPERHLCTAAVEASDETSVLVIDHGGRLDAAGWGGILSYAAQRRGVAGVVVDGACRDLDEIRELGLHLYARTAVPVSARGRVVEVDWDVSVEIGGVPVSPSDYVIGDASGIVVIPAGIADEVIGTAEGIAAKERAMVAAVDTGDPVSSVMGKDYETLTNMVGR